MTSKREVLLNGCFHDMRTHRTILDDAEKNFFGMPISSTGPKDIQTAADEILNAVWQAAVAHQNKPAKLFIGKSRLTMFGGSNKSDTADHEEQPKPPISKPG